MKLFGLWGGVGWWGGWNDDDETTPEDVHVSLSRDDSMSHCLRCQSVSAFITTAKHSSD